eukprot:1160125-Pelagomonas_calceolata.AAC.3
MNPIDSVACSTPVHEQYKGEQEQKEGLHPYHVVPLIRLLRESQDRKGRLIICFRKVSPTS